MNNEWPEPLVRPSIRAAVLTVSPITVYSSRSWEPTLPAMKRPLFTPMPVSNGSATPRSLSHSLKLAIRGPSISSAAASARFA